jgi:hypothetical protein
LVHALFAEVDASYGDVLCRGLADALDDDGGVGFEDDAVVDDLVDGECDEVVVLNDCSLVDGLPVVPLEDGKYGTLRGSYLKRR